MCQGVCLCVGVRVCACVCVRARVHVFAVCVFELLMSKYIKICVSDF